MAAGFDPDAFWRLTPRLYLIHMEGARKRMEREAKDTAWAVWHVAALGRVKKMPRLNQFMPSEKATRPTTWQGSLQAWQAYAERKKGGRGSASVSTDEVIG